MQFLSSSVLLMPLFRVGTELHLFVLAQPVTLALTAADRNSVVVVQILVYARSVRDLHSVLGAMLL